MRLSVTNRREVASNADGFIPREISSLVEFKEAVRFDHSPILFRDNYRKGENFLSCDFLYGDIDDGMSIEDFKKMFSAYNFIIATSRNHQKVKKDAPPCDRFHVYLPQEKPYTFAEEMKRDLLSMHAEYPFLDPSAKDIARLLYGNNDPIIFENKGIPYRPKAQEDSFDLEVVGTGHDFDNVKDDLVRPDREPFLSTVEGKAKAKGMLLALKERDRWHDMDSWMALRSALYREGFSLQDFIDLSWPNANCQKEWENMKDDRTGPRATGGSIVAWCREVDPNFLKPSPLVPSSKNPNPSQIIPSTHGESEKVFEIYFQEDPTHGRASDVIYEKMKGEVIYEKHGFERGAFYRRKVGTCYWEPFETVRTEARNILGRVADEQFLKAKASIANTEGDTIKGLFRKYYNHIKKSMTNDFLKSTVSLFSERVLVSPRVPWNMTSEALPCLDRVIDFHGSRTTARDALPGEYFVNPVPCMADDILNAGASPRFDRFMADLFVNSETRKTALHCFASCISGVPSKTAQVWHNWAGDGGKNTAFDAIRELLPGRITMLKPAIIQAKGDSGEKRFGLAQAEGKTGIFFDEISSEIDINQIKTLTGLSEIKGEKKGRDQYEFHQTWAFVILCNKLPKFRPADDSAFLARLLVLPFSSVFYRDEQDYEEKLAHGVTADSLKPAEDKAQIISELMAERPAIIRRLIDAWIDCRDNNNKTPYRSKECTKAGEKYKKDNDEVERFFDDYLEPCSYGTISYSELETLWIESSGNKRFSGMRWLVESLINKYGFIQRHRSNGTRVLKGIQEKQAFGDREKKDAVTDTEPIPF